MWATKSALTFGMHHCFFCHGLRAFFQVQAHRLVGQGLDHSQLHHPVRQQAQIPVVVALGGRTAGQGDEMGLVSASFDEIAEMEFERLPGMTECPARGALDDGLSTILGLPDLTGLRELLATELVVCNRRL